MRGLEGGSESCAVTTAALVAARRPPPSRPPTAAAYRQRLPPDLCMLYSEVGLRGAPRRGDPMTMLLDVETIREPNKRIERIEPPAAFEPEDVFRIVAPVELRLNLHKDKAKVRLTGTVKTTVEVDCSRCLEGFQVPIESTFDVQYLPTTAAPGGSGSRGRRAGARHGVLPGRRHRSAAARSRADLPDAADEAVMPGVVRRAVPGVRHQSQHRLLRVLAGVGGSPPGAAEGARAEERHRCLIRNAAIPRPGAASVAPMTRSCRSARASARSARKPRRRTACAQPAGTTRAGRSAPSNEQ